MIFSRRKLIQVLELAMTAHCVHEICTVLAFRLLSLPQVLIFALHRTLIFHAYKQILMPSLEWVASAPERRPAAPLEGSLPAQRVGCQRTGTWLTREGQEEGKSLLPYWQLLQRTVPVVPGTVGQLRVCKIYVLYSAATKSIFHIPIRRWKTLNRIW